MSRPTRLFAGSRLPLSLKVARRRTGFTLVELLTVIVIIGILATITMSISKMVIRQQSMARGSSEMDAIMTALKAFQHDNGDFPPMDGDSGGGSPTAEYNLLAALTGHARWIKDPVSGHAKWEVVGMNVQMNDGSVLPLGEKYNWGHAYIELDSFNIVDRDTSTPSGLKDSSMLLDPWDNPYLYRYITIKDTYTPTNRNWQTDSPVLISRGPDGQPVNPDDNFVWKSVNNHTQDSGMLTDDYTDPAKNPLLRDNLVRSVGFNIP